MALVAVAGLAGATAAGRSALPARPALAPPPVAAAPLADTLVAAVGADGAVRQLQGLQRVADEHDGDRASTTAGYDASVDLVAGQLRAAGFEVATPTFAYQEEVVRARRLRVGGTELRADPLGRSRDTPDAGTSGPLVVLPEDRTPGCQESDLAGLPVAGAVVLVRRGGCTFQRKTERAVAAGAGAVVVVNTEDRALTDGTLGEPAAVPVGGVSRADGEALRSRAGEQVTLDLRSSVETLTSRNVVAQTRTGRTDAVLMAGAHLDSVRAGPGTNDNGSGAAGLLELALALGSRPALGRAVRFAWWGAEEAGLHGSQAYVGGLGAAERRDLDLYLNLDMIASPNPGYFVYDGDDSAREGGGPGPSGSEEVEQTLVDGLARQGLTSQPTDFDGRSDYGPFIAAGIPAGGLFSGAEGDKSPEQAALWGGTAGAPFDPCYHRACDDLGNLDRTAFDRHLDALAWTVGRYAQPDAAPLPTPTAVAPPAVQALPPRGARRVSAGRTHG